MNKFKNYSDKIVKGSFLFIILSGSLFNLYFFFIGKELISLNVIIITSLFLLAYLYSEKLFKEKLFFIPSAFFYIAIIFTFFSSYLGSFLNFYEKFEFWDDILHFVSGILLGILCIILTSFVIVKRFGEINRTPYILYMVIVGVLISISLAVFWEFYEFSYDYLTDGNMQRSIIIENPENFDPSPYLRPSGRFIDPGLLDTMGDFFQAVLGAILAGIYCFSHYALIVKKIEEYDLEE
ncbi:MAG: hypothetical protein ACK5LM_06210 [Lactovum sp.]